jgi:hypothetical protein
MKKQLNLFAKVEKAYVVAGVFVLRIYQVLELKF